MNSKLIFRFLPFILGLYGQDDQRWGTIGPCRPVEMPKIDMQYMTSAGYPNLATEDAECTFRFVLRFFQSSFKL